MLLRLLILSLLITLPVSSGSDNGRLYYSNNRMLSVKKISFPCKKPPIALVEKMLDSCSVPFHSIDCLNWKAYPYKPDVQFRIAWSNEEIYLQYRVKERYIRAKFTEDTGSQPYKDSCVEFFMIPAGDSIYYNLEMNCIGTCTFAGGAKRTERTRFGNDVTSQVRRSSSLGKDGFDTKDGEFEWTITMAIPISIYSLSKFDSLGGRSVKANFYKCGDELPEPHYLSWNPINLEKPNFHTPDFFRDIYFEK